MCWARPSCCAPSCAPHLPAGRSRTTDASGALVGLLAAAWVVVPWWRKNRGGQVQLGKGDKSSSAAGGRNWKTLQPFALSWLVGCCTTLCAGGLLGGLAARIGGGSNTAGGWLLGWLTGAHSPAIARHAQHALQPDGAVLLVVAVVVAVIWWRGSGRPMRRDMILGALSGTTLGPCAGIAGLIAVTAGQLLNQGGALLLGWL